ncbi:hypothetical protein, partial [Escherichia coli]|uniref:hypothetical protein n=1 Tax=Escherichia coli TaxID=562 RepID=UPI00091BF150
MTALAEAFNNVERETLPLVVGVGYGLSYKEFGPDCGLAGFARQKDGKTQKRVLGVFLGDVSKQSHPLPGKNLPKTGEKEALVFSLGGRVTGSLDKQQYKN